MAEILDPTNIRQAAAKVDEACRHYDAHRKALAEVRSDVPLMGGFGETGGYMKGLYRFTVAYQEVLDEFLRDEEDFVAFLGGFRDRIQQTAGLYQETELRNEERFTRISRTLAGGG